MDEATASRAAQAARREAEAPEVFVLSAKWSFVRLRVGKFLSYERFRCVDKIDGLSGAVSGGNWLATQICPGGSIPFDSDRMGSAHVLNRRECAERAIE